MRHPELKLALALERDVRRHQREIAEAFAEAQRQNRNRWAALRREFPMRSYFVVRAGDLVDRNGRPVYVSSRGFRVPAEPC